MRVSFHELKLSLTYTIWLAVGEQQCIGVSNSNFTNTRYAKTGVKTLHVIQMVGLIRRAALRIVHTLFYSRKILENRRKSCEDRTIVIGVNKSYKLRLNRKCWHLWHKLYLIQYFIQWGLKQPSLILDLMSGDLCPQSTIRECAVISDGPKITALVSHSTLLFDLHFLNGLFFGWQQFCIF